MEPAHLPPSGSTPAGEGHITTSGKVLLLHHNRLCHPSTMGTQAPESSSPAKDDDSRTAREKSIEEWLPINSSRHAKWWYSAFHNVTAMVGAGVLGLPYAMSELGWGPGIAVMILSWVITLYTLWQMVEKSIEEWLPINSSRHAKWWYSAFHNVTAMVGAGVLGLPYAMSELGCSETVEVKGLPAWTIVRDPYADALCVEDFIPAPQLAIKDPAIMGELLGRKCCVGRLSNGGYVYLDISLPCIKQCQQLLALRPQGTADAAATLPPYGPRLFAHHQEAGEVLPWLPSRLGIDDDPAAAGRDGKPPMPACGGRWRVLMLGNGGPDNPNAVIFVLDSGAERHVCALFCLFSSMFAEPPGNAVLSASGHTLPILGSGSVVLPGFRLGEVKLVPGATRNIVYVSVPQLVQLDYSVDFSRAGCFVRDARSDGAIVGKGRKVDGLYQLEFLDIPLDRAPAPAPAERD